MESLTNTRRFLGHALTAIAISAAASQASFADAPDCMSGSSAMPIDNQAVLALKASTPNQYLARAHVSGTVGQIYADEHGHNHFELIIGSGPTDTIEIVYNISFGELPQMQAGMSVEACGDFINSDAATSEYPESPDNAIMHWVHRNPKGRGHASGFLEIDGQLYGQGDGRGD
jgi:hypothetical protein